jgi:hypothetical protein
MLRLMALKMWQLPYSTADTSAMKQTYFRNIVGLTYFIGFEEFCVLGYNAV